MFKRRIFTKVISVLGIFFFLGVLIWMSILDIPKIYAISMAKMEGFKGNIFDAFSPEDAIFIPGICLFAFEIILIILGFILLFKIAKSNDYLKIPFAQIVIAVYSLFTFTLAYFLLYKWGLFKTSKDPKLLDEFYSVLAIICVFYTINMVFLTLSCLPAIKTFIKFLLFLLSYGMSIGILFYIGKTETLVAPLGMLIFLTMISFGFSFLGTFNVIAWNPLKVKKHKKS